MMRGERGQTLVHVALLMVVFLSILAIAIDVGRIYSERRRMQNAADAGALAGAREICLDPKAYGGDWYAAAFDYAVNRNVADTADISRDGWTVDVVARTTMDTTFAKVFGIATVNVGANAAAACGAAQSACGLWPIALEEGRFQSLYDHGNGCGDETPFYVWNGDNPNQQPDCEVCQCDVNEPPDGIEDILGIEDRTWVDFSEVVDPHYPDDCAQPGFGAQELKCWLEHDSGAMIRLDSCICGDNGVKAGTKAAVDSRIGNIVAIPIYDSTDCTTEQNCAGQTYHIPYFACIRVGANGWIQNYELYEKADPSQVCWKGNVIEAHIVCDGSCDTNCGSTPGVPPPPWGVWAVSLIR